MQTSAAVLASPPRSIMNSFYRMTRWGDPLVLVHGGAHTGACYRCTPMGRPGWAADFAAQGFEVLIPGLARLRAQRLRAAGPATGGPRRRGARRAGRTDYPTGHRPGPLDEWPLRFQAPGNGAALRPGWWPIAARSPGNVQPLPAIIAEADDAVEVQVLALRWRIPKAQDFLMDQQMVRVKLVGNGGRFRWTRSTAIGLRWSRCPARLLYERKTFKAASSDWRTTRICGDRGCCSLPGTHDTDHPREVDQRVAGSPSAAPEWTSYGSPTGASRAMVT